MPMPPEAELKLYDDLIAKFGKVPRKGKNNPYTSLNGHMFSYLGKDGVLALRLPKEEREKFLKDYKTKLDVQYNTVMKEYVRVPKSMLKDQKKVMLYLKKSYGYVSTLEPT